METFLKSLAYQIYSAEKRPSDLTCVSSRVLEEISNSLLCSDQDVTICDEKTEISI